MHADLSLKECQKEWHGTVKSYVIGFLASLVLTATSFFLVVARALPEQILIYTIVTLALVQAILQLLFFLHLGQEAKPRWETVVFYFMVTILLIIALGSLWIISDLNERMMPEMMTKEMPHD